MANPLMEKSNEALVDAPTPNTQYEFMRRQTVAQQDAAQAAKDTAIYTQKNARYMLWSVIAIAVTSGLNALFAFLTWYAPHCG